MYKLELDTKTGAEFIRRITDSASIPQDPANTDYQEYLAWLDEGNTPEPAEEQQ